MNPNIITRKALLIAGVSGDGDNTAEVWGNFMKLQGDEPLANTVSQNSYEIRVYDGDKCTVHVGLPVSSAKVHASYSLFALPASKNASFEVYLSHGYESENNAMDEWIRTNKEGYTEKLLNGAHYCVEYYDERFNGSESGSIVEIWVPIEKGE